jgi:CDP-diacylglycerol--glycerol-3-phosphate 3-phosphatidyltransferase
VPIFVIVYFLEERDTKIYAILVYALASFSDFLDGFVARKYKASSNLGKLLDPLGDKMMTIAVMLCITIDGILPIWAVLVAGIKEILMAIGGFVVHKVAHVEIPPSKLIGKVSTVVFFLVCVTIMIFDIPAVAVTAMISTAIGLALLALASYVSTYVAVMRSRKKNAPDTEPQ